MYVQQLFKKVINRKTKNEYFYKMRVAALQTDLHWENVSANHIALEQQIGSLKEVDLIVLPEMFSVGFTMNPSKVAEKIDGASFIWMQKMAKKTGATIVGSLPIVKNKKFYNTLMWVQPDGKYFSYNKRHLFRMAGEHKVFEKGDSLLVVTLKHFRCCPLICYDLRFPVWSRNIASDLSIRYDVLIYVANWPAPRSNAWTCLLKARAIENQCYVIGVNRIGVDGNGINYSGESRIFGPKGERIDEFEANKSSIQQVNLDFSYLANFREKFPVSKDADLFNLL